MGGRRPFQNLAGSSVFPYQEKMNLKNHLTPSTKTNFRWPAGLNVMGKTTEKREGTAIFIFWGREANMSLKRPFSASPPLPVTQDALLSGKPAPGRAGGHAGQVGGHAGQAGGHPSPQPRKRADVRAPEWNPTLKAGGSLYHCHSLKTEKQASASPCT